MDLAKKAWSALGEGERRIGFTFDGTNLLVTPSSTGFSPQASDASVVGDVLRAAGVQFAQALLIVPGSAPIQIK